MYVSLLCLWMMSMIKNNASEDTSWKFTVPRVRSERENQGNYVVQRIEGKYEEYNTLEKESKTIKDISKYFDDDNVTGEWMEDND